jgi:hypothetical protein
MNDLALPPEGDLRLLGVDPPQISVLVRERGGFHDTVRRLLTEILLLLQYYFGTIFSSVPR